MPWSATFVEEMRIKQDIRHLVPPQSLILSNNSIRDVDDLDLKSINCKVSPETLNYRLERGWQNLKECPETFQNNNNGPFDVNDNKSEIDEAAIVASSSSEPSVFMEGNYRTMSDDESSSDSSSDDESSESFSDTSPLLDVSSLGNSDDSDMSEDSSSSSSSSSSDSEEEEDCGNNNNNNINEEDDDMSMGEPSMQSSWMSFSSAASSSPSVPAGSSRVLPDVLPVSQVSKEIEEDNSYGPLATRNLEITFEKRKSQENTSSNISSGDRCLVEITAQPEIHIDIRVNSSETRPTAIKHGNTYPREAKSNKRYLKNRDINAWIVNDSFDEHYDDRSSKCNTLDEGIRLNNFTIMNGHKTLSLTELTNTNSKEEITDFCCKAGTITQHLTADSKVTSTVYANTYQNFERNYSKLPANVHLYRKDNWRHQKDLVKAVPTKKPTASELAAVPKLSALSPKLDEAKQRTSNRNTLVEEAKGSGKCPVDNSDNVTPLENLLPKIKDESKTNTFYYSANKKSNEGKTSSPELFDVYTMETALPQIDWAAVTKNKRESEWIRKRRNDREEIRRKLAMDSDTEDYISEKLSHHRNSAGSLDHLKSSGNLQICFMNEAAKDQDLSNPEDEVPSEKISTAIPRRQKPSLQLLSGVPSKFESATPNRTEVNLSLKPSVTKRQRPKFFFNRPRSWHASKQDETLFPEEDLLTRHVRLQAEAREALAQAKDMARMQMEIERQKKKKSPIADIV